MIEVSNRSQWSSGSPSGRSVVSNTFFSLRISSHHKGTGRSSHPTSLLLCIQCEFNVHSMDFPPLLCPPKHQHPHQPPQTHQPPPQPEQRTFRGHRGLRARSHADTHSRGLCFLAALIQFLSGQCHHSVHPLDSQQHSGSTLPSQWHSGSQHPNAIVVRATLSLSTYH